MDNEENLGIYDVVNKLKEEIKKLEDQGKDNHLFKIDKVTVQLSVAVDKHVGGGVDVWVFRAGGLFKKENTHTITLELSPLDDAQVAVADIGKPSPIELERGSAGNNSEKKKRQKGK